jgi:hypothetical protein
MVWTMLTSSASSAGREGHRMLLGNADIEAALGEFRFELVEAGAGRHGGGDGDDLGVALRLGHQGLGEDAGIAWRAGGRLGLLARNHIELLDAVIFVGRRLGRAIALALLGDDMDQHRALVGIPHIFQDRDQRVEIVAVDRADIIEAQFLEERAAGHPAAGEFVGLAGRAVERIGQAPGDAAGEIA